jgi:molybdopterin molybdotransferase
MSSALPNYEQAAATVARYADALRRRVERRIERIDLHQAHGRVLAHPIAADEDQPPFARSTRDGFACRAADASAHIQLHVAGSTHAGEAPGGPLPPHAAWEIMTGAPVPSGADAVVMLEHVERAGEFICLLPSRTLESGDNIVARGAQARQGNELLPAGILLDAAQVALAASCGCAYIEVFARPRVAILTTGDELVPVDAAPGPGQIRNSNALMLAFLVAGAGGEPWVLPTAADTVEALDSALNAAASADMLLISGGVSAGKFDLVEPALARMSARVFFTGVRIQPGKPLVFGELPRHSESDKGEKPFFGLPGNPISSAVTFLLFASSVLAALAGSRKSSPRFALAKLTKTTGKRENSGLTRFFPAFCDFNSSSIEHPGVERVPWHGSGDLAAFARANCFVVLPEDGPLLDTGSIVRILLL